MTGGDTETSLQLSGLVGGLVATVTMTVVMMVVGDDSPPAPARLWAKYVGDGPAEEYMMQRWSCTSCTGSAQGGCSRSPPPPGCSR